MHNESITSLSELPCHLELEEEWYGFRTDVNTYVTNGKSRFKGKWHDKAHTIEFRREHRRKKTSANLGHLYF